MYAVVLVIIVAIVTFYWIQKAENFDPSFGWKRYGYPYSYYGTWYRPQGYWGSSFSGDPYGYGGSTETTTPDLPGMAFGYGGKQQDLYCRLGCSKSDDPERCLDLCEAHGPYYDFD